MKVIAVNGSPRKKWNTATLLVKALEGAASCRAKTDLIHAGRPMKLGQDLPQGVFNNIELRKGV